MTTVVTRRLEGIFHVHRAGEVAGRAAAAGEAQGVCVITCTLSRVQLFML
jgi:hypothetical protein